MLGNKPPYTTMQQLNLDWVLSKLKTLLRLVPDDGAVGQILRRTRDGAVWSDEQGGGGGGAVQSVNGKTGAVVLDATDVGALPDDYTPPVTSVNGQTGAVTVSVPVQSVNGQTGAVVLDADDVGALPDDYTPPVTSVNGQTGEVVLDAADVGALPDDYTPPVTSVNGQTGAVSIFQSNDIGNETKIPVGTTFTCPSDGYLFVFCAYNTSALSRADICDKNGNEIIRFQLANAPANYIGINSVPVFVRKGMKIRSHSTTDSGYIAFYPIV
jgi:hypothetical protein